MSSREFTTGGGGTGEIYTESLQDTGENITLKVDASGAPGRLTMNVDVEGSIGISFSNLFAGGTQNSVDVRYISSIASSVKENIRSQSRTVLGLVSNLPPEFYKPSTPPLPSEVRSISSDPLPLAANVGQRQIGGTKDPETINKRLRFEPILIPEAIDNSSFSTDDIFGASANFGPVNESIDISQLEEIGIEISVIPREVIQRTFGNLPEVTLTVPMRVFARKANITQANCSVLYPDIDRRIDSFSSTLDSFETFADELQRIIEDQQLNTDQKISELRSRRRTPEGFNRFPSEVRSFVSGTFNTRVKLPTCGESFASRLQEIQSRYSNISDRLSNLQQRIDGILSKGVNCAQEFSDINSELNSVESRINSASDLTEQEFSSIQDTLSSLEGQVGSTVAQDSPCFKQFNSRISRLRSKAQSIFEGTQLDCTDVPRNIRRQVSRYETRATVLAGRSPSGVSVTMLQNAITRAEDIKTKINDAVSSSNPCKSQLLNRVTRAEQTVRDLLKEKGGKPPESEVSIPCSEKFPDVDAAVEDFKQASLNLDPPLTPDQIQQINRKANEVEQKIESQVPASSDCREQFLGEIRTAVSRVRRLTGTIRIETGGGDGGDNKTQKLIERLTEQLENIQLNPPESDAVAT